MLPAISFFVGSPSLRNCSYAFTAQTTSPVVLQAWPMLKSTFGFGAFS